MTETAFGLFHYLSDGMEVVTGGDYGKKQNENTTERADEQGRSPCRAIRGSPLPPQRVRGQ